MGVIQELKFELAEMKAALMGIMRCPQGHRIDRLEFWEDANGNVKYIKAIQGSSLPLFTLEFSDAGASTAVTWSLIRS